MGSARCARSRRYPGRSFAGSGCSSAATPRSASRAATCRAVSTSYPPFASAQTNAPGAARRTSAATATSAAGSRPTFRLKCRNPRSAAAATAATASAGPAASTVQLNVTAPRPTRPHGAATARPARRPAKSSSARSIAALAMGCPVEYPGAITRRSRASIPARSSGSRPSSAGPRCRSSVVRTVSTVS